MIPSVAAISQQYAQFAPRGCCRWPRVCVWSRSINAADLRLPEYNGRVKCAQTIFQSVWPSPAISLSITLSTPSHPSSLNMQQISLSRRTHTGSKTSFNPKTEFQISMLIKMKMFLLTFPRPSFDHAVFSVRYECDGTVCSQCAAGVRLMRAAVGRVRVGPS